MRSDAVLRRKKLIDAACSLFRTHPSTTVTLEAIASRAEVGIATLYRNFPTRRHLNVACGIAMLTDIGLLIEELKENFHTDPRAQWDGFVWKLLDVGAWPWWRPSRRRTLAKTPN